MPHAAGWDAWARLGLSTLGTMIALRNLLVSMYEASDHICLWIRVINLYRHPSSDPPLTESPPTHAPPSKHSNPQLAMDNTAPYPLLNPTLLSRIRSIVAVRPRGLATLITVLHIHSFCTLYGLTTLGVKMGNLPGAWPTACQGGWEGWLDGW